MRTKLFLIAPILFLFLSCSSDDSSSVEFATTPETKPEVDGTSFGVYKGLLMGVEGSVKVVINNGDNMANAYIYRDGVVKETLTTTATFTVGEAISNAHFSNANVSFDFSVEADGSNPVMENVVVNNARVAVVDGYLIRETSDVQVYCYEGRFSGDDSGIFKCMINGTQLVGYVLNSDDETYSASAIVTDNSFSAVFGSVSSGANFQGSFTLYACGGDWYNLETGESGTFRGPRTL